MERRGFLKGVGSLILGLAMLPRETAPDFATGGIVEKGARRWFLGADHGAPDGPVFTCSEAFISPDEALFYRHQGKTSRVLVELMNRHPELIRAASRGGKSFPRA